MLEIVGITYVKIYHLSIFNETEWKYFKNPYIELQKTEEEISGEKKKGRDQRLRRFI